MCGNSKVVLLTCATIILQAQTVISYPTASQGAAGLTGTERQRLLNYATQEYTELATMIVQETIKMFEKVLAQVGNKPSQELEPHIRELSAYVERSKSLSSKQGEAKTNEIFDLFEISANFTTKFDAMTPNVASDVAKMDALLKANGVDELSTGFVSHFLRMINALEEQVADYLKALTPIQKLKETKMANWQQRLADEANISNKIDLFVEFFHFYEQ